MPKTNTKNADKAQLIAEPTKLTNSTFELVNWSLLSTSTPLINEKVLALQTTRFCPQASLTFKPSQQTSSIPSLLSNALDTENLKNESSPYDYFNLGLHVGDKAELVNFNRNTLQKFITQQLTDAPTSSSFSAEEPVKIQWLEQVHGNDVVEVIVVNNSAITADASITRKKNIALAIMTADCLPILLSNKNGSEIAAIHGGWRSLAANIISNTLDKMHSDSRDIIAWLGPCISKDAFEVGAEVKGEFIKQNMLFNEAFSKRKNGNYLADLHKIAQLQLQSLGVTAISTLAECTMQRTDKYYSYRKEQVTGRMASIICRK